MTDLDNKPNEGLFQVLLREEKTAFLAKFRGAYSHVTQYDNTPDNVSFGKAECEWVGFTDFWLGKAVDLGLFTAEVVKTGMTKGMTDNCKYTEWRIAATELGHKTYSEYMDGRR